MKKQNKIKELYDWLEANKIQYSIVDDDVVELPDFGKLFFQDTTKSTYNSLFRKDRDGELIFNSMEEPDVLTDEGINYIAFKFGDNFYYTDLRKDFKMNILKYIGKRMEPTCPHPYQYVNLGVHTPYELLNGSFMPDMWVKKAKYLGHIGIGICDRNTMAACYTLQKECEGAELLPVFGYSLSFMDGDQKVGAKVYVQTQEGLRHLLRIQKAIMVDGVDNVSDPKDAYIDVDELIRLGGGLAIVFDKYSSKYIYDNQETMEDFEDAFDSLYYQVDLSEYRAERIDVVVLEATKFYFDSIYSNTGLPTIPAPILLTDSYYLDKDDSKNKIILNKIANNGVAHNLSDDQYFKDIDEHWELFEQLFDSDKWNVQDIFRDCCESTIEILEGAKARFDNTRNFMPKYDMTPEEKEKYGTAHNMFTLLLEEGLEKLAPKGQEERYRKQMEYEKYIIESTDNVDYLLVQYDTCNWARRNNILVGCGRGSAAGSLLLYLMGITLIDPIKYDLIFERFLLPERAGLFPADTTIIGEDIDSKNFIELTLENGKIIKVDKDAELMVKREGQEEPLRVYADELEENDDILFDNKDLLFTLNEI